MEPEDGLVDEAIEAQRAVMRSLQNAASGCWLELDLSMAQMKTLFVLADVGSSSIGRVGEILGVTLPTASHLIEKLVAAGLVERAWDPADRRRTLTRPTAAGEELVRNLRQGRRELLRSWLIRMDGTDLRALVRGLRALESAALEEAAGREAAGCERMTSTPR